MVPRGMHLSSAPLAYAVLRGSLLQLFVVVVVVVGSSNQAPPSPRRVY